MPCFKQLCLFYFVYVVIEFSPAAKPSSQQCLPVTVALISGLIGALAMLVFTTIFILGLLQYRVIRKGDNTTVVEHRRASLHSENAT